MNIFEMDGLHRGWLFICVLWALPTFSGLEDKARVEHKACKEAEIPHADRLTVDEFGAWVKEKYPAYNDMTDRDVGSRTLAKYPEYKRLTVGHEDCQWDSARFGILVGRIAEWIAGCVLLYAICLLVRTQYRVWKHKQSTRYSRGH